MTFPSFGAVSIGCRMQKDAFPSYIRLCADFIAGRGVLKSLVRYLLSVLLLVSCTHRSPQGCAFALAHGLRQSGQGRPFQTTRRGCGVSEIAPGNRRDVKVGRTNSAMQSRSDPAIMIGTGARAWRRSAPSPSAAEERDARRRPLSRRDVLSGRFTGIARRLRRSDLLQSRCQGLT